MSLLLLFDIDGTLLRTNGAGMRALAQGFQDGMGWADALVGVSPAGMTDSGIAQEVALRRCGRRLSEKELASIFSRYLECLQVELQQENSGFRVLPGVREFLDQHSQRPKWTIGLGTGNLEAGARIKLQHGGLDVFFAFGGFGSDAENRAEVLRIGVRRAEAAAGKTFAPEQVIIIGDTPLDVAAARAIGARSLAVATGPFGSQALRDSGADCVVETFSDAAAIDRFLVQVGGRHD